jgi:hypothetical protein
MNEKSETLRREPEPQTTPDRELGRDEIRQALRRLRGIGEKLPVVDAVAIVREGRNLSDHNSL